MRLKLGNCGKALFGLNNHELEQKLLCHWPMSCTKHFHEHLADWVARFVYRIMMIQETGGCMGALVFHDWKTRGLEIWKIMLLFLLFSCAVCAMNDACYRGICFSFVMHGIKGVGSFTS